MWKSVRGLECGQASVEHVGLLALLAIVLGALSVATPVAGYAGELAAGIAGSFGERSAEARPPENSWAESRATVDRLLDADLDEFLAYRDSPDRDPRLDYSTDQCSAPLIGSSGASFDFTEACLRHDFGYRNYDRLGLFGQRREAVDARFLADMRSSCAARPSSDLARCLTWARVFYEAVHRLGHLTGHGD